MKAIGMEPQIVDVNPKNLDSLPCCGIKSAAHCGRQEKCDWVRRNFRRGLRCKALVAADGKVFGYLEVLPGEDAWRRVDAAGYLFIQCIWVHSKQYQGRGWGTRLLNACVEDARQAGKRGVAVLARSGPWMADPRLFAANGFATVATAPPDYELMVLKFDARAANPTMRAAKELRCGLRKGLTLVRSSQCPYAAKFANEIIEAARDAYGIEPHVVQLRSAGDAQEAPTPSSVFSILFDGRVVADHPISRTRFMNIMNKLSAAPLLKR